MADPETFDCFLSHNSRDKPAVRALAAALGARGVVVWLDEARLRPGLSAQRQMDSGIRQSRSIAVLVGADGLGPWEQEEMEAALSLAVRDGRPVIPVLLPDAPAVPPLPLFLANRTWVDLRPAGRGEAAGLDDLIWGITGERPTATAGRATPTAGTGPTAAEQGPMNTAPPIRILHLSDLHLRTDRTWDSDPVLAALARHIADEVRAGLVPDLVAITGDLAYSGKAAEYRLAHDWLERQLWPALTPAGATPLPRDRLLLVPGNHDVDRGAVNFMVKTAQEALLKDCGQNDIAAVLKDPEQRDLFLRRHAAWLDFCAGWYGLAPDAPWWQRTLTLGTQRLHCAGLDSAWMSARDREQGALLLGRWQVHQTVLARGGTDADWTLALLHHPWSCLDDRDTAETRPLIQLHRDLVLRGHRHQTDSAQIVRPDPKRTCLELAAGCVYDGSPYPNAFQWIELRPATAAEPRRVRVRLRAWVQGAWQVDRNQPNCPDGETTFALPAAVGTGPGSGPRPADDPGRYLEALLAETAYIEVRGLSTGGPQAHRYPIGDLYIELQTAGGNLPAERRAETGQAPAGRVTDHPLRAALTHPRLVISGDPGCGKTTFLRWVAHCLAAERLGQDPGAAARHLGLPTAPLPILVRIGDWLDYMERVRADPGAPKVAHSPDWLPAFLGAHAAEHQFGLDAAAFRALFKQGQALILLDGLDEAPDRRQRADVARIIEELDRTWPKCPLVVTSRPGALAEQTILPGFAHTAIERLDDTAIAGFLDRWSRALFRNEPARAEAHRRELAAALASRPEIRRLARNAVMLSALAVVHWNDKRLPEQRAELYESIIRWLLLARETRPGRTPPERSRQLLADLALAMQTDPRGRSTQLSRRAAAERIAHRFPAGGPTALEPVDQAEAYLAEEELDSGIVVRRGHELRYWHLTFQEYLAACALAGKPDAAAVLLEPATDPLIYRTEWRETVLLLAGVLYLQGQDRTDALVTAVLDRLGTAPTRAAQARAAGLIGALVRDLAPFGYRPADPRYAQVLEAALAVFDRVQAATIPLPDRIDAAEALAQAGDPRLGWDNPRRWVELPGGAFTMGAQKSDPQAPGHDPEAYDDEAPVHEVRVSAFRIGRYPVTVAEFADFLADEDCRDPRWWQAGGADAAGEPGGWEDQQAHPSRPVVNVTWYQAMAYCAWLTERLRRHQGLRDCPILPDGWEARLPTEAEWEYAARGNSERRYPWGSEPPDPGRANYDETKLDAPSPVGVFPGGATPEGVQDLAGNVWEWCLDGYSEDFYARCQAEGEVANPCATAPAGSSRVLRGGSFGVESWNLRAAFRNRSRPENRIRNIGFRCVLGVRAQPPIDPLTH